MKDLTTGNIYKSFFLFSIPLILSDILSRAFQIIDTSIASLFLGAKGLAALGSTGSSYGIAVALIVGFMAGVSVHLGTLYGARDYKKFKMVFNSNFLVLTVVSLVVSILAIALYKPIMAFMKVDPYVYDDALTYYILMFANMMPSVLFSYYVSVCYAMGISIFPMALSSLATILNLIGNVLSVTVFDLGVFGIGLSSIISTAIIILCFAIRFCFYFRKMGVEKEKFHFEWNSIKVTLPAAIPNSFQQFFIYFVGFLLAPIKNGLGYMAVAAISIVTNINSLVTMFYQASSKTLSNYISQCVGAKKYDLIKKSVGVAWLQSILFMAPIMLSVWLFPDIVGVLYFNEETELEVINYVHIYIKYFYLFNVLGYAASIFHAALRGINNGKFLVISQMTASLSNLAFSYVLCRYMGLMGFYLAAVLGWVSELLFVAVIYFSGTWIPKSLRPFIHKGKSQNVQE